MSTDKPINKYRAYPLKFIVITVMYDQTLVERYKELTILDNESKMLFAFI